MISARRGLFAALLVLSVFCAAGVSAQPSDDGAVLAIDAGRLLAMLSQVSALLKEPDTDEPRAEGTSELLEFAVARYNVLHARACEKDVVEGPQCAAAYAPALQPEPVPSSVLRREVNGAEDQILPFWEAVCAKLDDPVHPACQLE